MWCTGSQLRIAPPHGLRPGTAFIKVYISDTCFVLSFSLCVSDTQWEYGHQICYREGFSRPEGRRLSLKPIWAVNYRWPQMHTLAEGFKDGKQNKVLVEIQCRRISLWSPVSGWSYYYVHVNFWLFIIISFSKLDKFQKPSPRCTVTTNIHQLNLRKF